MLRHERAFGSDQKETIVFDTQTDSTKSAGSIDLQIDWEHLHQLSENNAEFEFELLQIFVEDAQARLEETKAAITANDFQQVERQAHHLKGSSANVGATAMHLAAEKLQQLAHNQQFGDSAKLVSELDEFVNRIQAFLMVPPSRWTLQISVNAPS